MSHISTAGAAVELSVLAPVLLMLTSSVDSVLTAPVGRP
jgi:hypothetical protein